MGMGLGIVKVPRYIQATNDFAIGTMYGCSGACPLMMGQTIMLRPYHLNRRVIVQGNADGIGANL
ncbi:hypothetical protein SDC9_151883 [bioreactor metagenome]|uniref:Uncharacterized protein n=1 Tax=bioreactor metagenome TaxID=1076179 RepID=A0A645ERH1_9ZZZZ